MVFAPSGGVVDGGCASSGGAADGGAAGAAATGAEAFGGAPRAVLAACPRSCVSAGWMPTIVAFFTAMGRICGALARGKPCELCGGAPGRAAGDIARGV